MKTHRARLAAAAVCLLALAGCGDDGKASSAKPSASSTVSQAPTATPSATPSASATPAAPHRPSRAARTLGGLIEKTLAQGGAHVEITLGTAGASGDVDFSSGKPAVDIIMRQPGQPHSRLIAVGGKIYAQSEQTGGEKFMALDSAFNIDAYGLNPDSLLDQVKAFKRGKDLGGGHFRFTQEGRTLDFFFGAGELLQRMVMSGGLPDDSKLKVTWTDWGKDVDIQAPAAKDVVTMPSASPAA